MKKNTAAWIEAMRLRTLPLALSTGLTGVGLAIRDGAVQPDVVALLLLTITLLQITSNLANDYGDFQHGTDSEDRVGPMRTLQSGKLNAAQMKQGIAVCSMLSFVSGVCLLLVSPHLSLLQIGGFVLLGLLAILAAIKYTAGSNPYGYSGLGDLSVLLFFGIVGVSGSYYLMVGSLDPLLLLPSISVGLFAAGVLHLNNTRDIEGDLLHGKRTLASRLGASNSKRYHLAVLATGWLCMLLYALAVDFENLEFLFVFSLPLFIINGYKTFTSEEPKELDPLLKQLAISTFVFAVTLVIGLAVSS